MAVPSGAACAFCGHWSQLASQQQRLVFTPAEVLAHATSLSGELLQLSGDCSPYPGKIDVIQKGAHADLLLIDGNPLEDIFILLDHEKNLDLIMTGGMIYKQTMN